MSTEYRTLISLTDELRCAVQSDLVPLSGCLVAEHLISPDNASQLRNPMHSEAARAAKLVEIIQNRVQQNAQHYHTFVRVLENQGLEYYRDILSRLREVYQQLELTDNNQEQVTHSQVPDPSSVRGSDHSSIKQRVIHRTEPDDDENAGVVINARSRLSRQDSQSNSTVHAGQIWCCLLKASAVGGSLVLLAGVVVVYCYYYSGARQPGLGRAHEQDCTKIESPRVLFQELKEIGSWEDLCLNLGVRMAVMESLKRESAQNTEKKRQCLKAFYDEDTEPEVAVCWEKVAKAVSSFPISNKKLAKKIANKYSINTATIDL